jgi:predicted metal-dependent hydrolase
MSEGRFQRGEGVSPLRPEGEPYGPVRVLPSVSSSPSIGEVKGEEETEEEARGRDAHGTQGQDALATIYIVKENPRSRYVRLRMSVQDGLVITIPRGFDRGQIPGILDRKKRWLASATQAIAEQRARWEADPPNVAPAKIALPAIAQEWAVEYRPAGGRGVTAMECPGNRILVTGDTAKIGLCKGLLRLWLRRKAREHLVPWLKRVADEKGFAFSRASIRAQKSRWGSCSRRGTISLNLKILFLPPELVRYVLLHELCHTRRMDHSKHYWALLREHAPDCKQQAKLLRADSHFVPAWVERHGR